MFARRGADTFGGGGDDEADEAKAFIGVFQRVDHIGVARGSCEIEMEGFVGLDESHAVDGIAWADVFQRFPIGALTGQKIGWEPAGGEGVDHEQLERETKIIKVIDAFGIGLLDKATPVRDLVDETLFGQCAQRLTDRDPTGR